jgi:hypothetical protein
MAHLTVDPASAERSTHTTLPGTGPPPGTAPPPVVTGPDRPRRSRALWVVGIAVLVVLGVVVGVSIWALWLNRAPAVPTDLTASATAVSVDVAWTPGDGDVTVEEYLVLRDGDVVGTVPGSQTTFLDEDLNLVPGAEYDYQVVASSGRATSDASEHLLVRTLAPSPVDLGPDPSTPSAVAFHWSRPPDGPVPDTYVVVRNGEELSPVSGLTDYYSEEGLEPGTSIDFQVIAVWGENSSEPSDTLTVSTLQWAAPLQGSWQVGMETTESTTNLDVGEKWTDTWTFTPECAESGCDVTVEGSISPPGFADRSFTATLNRSGDVYEGTATAKISKCGDALVDNTLTLSLKAVEEANNGLWSSWSGTLVMESPRTSISSTRYCPAGSTSFALTADGS